MKTPEEIKKGLLYHGNTLCDDDCPYRPLNGFGCRGLLCDDALALIGNAVENGEVLLFDAPLAHGGGKNARRRAVARDENKAARVAVEAVDGTKDEGDAHLGIAIGKGICHGVLVMVVRGVSRHVGRLVGYDDIRVLVNDAEVECNREQILLRLCIVGSK